MLKGQDLKRLVAAIPDDAIVNINGHWEVGIESVTVESPSPFGGPTAVLHLTKGYSITKDEVLKALFTKKKTSFPDAETR